ncbi:ABC transporter permease [Fredinandcohnia sp. 179-A 10B2 NHS]|uniref:ABC transporter permease n=1 Tax=Fredinandcohnia sp. 179-A 10B2 NHS TaxID=3235176 RepID=UPI0039A32E87
MNFIKRALLSVSARKGKSLLQIVVFSVICVLVLSGLSIQSAAEKSTILARQQLGGQVTLQFDMEKAREQQEANGERTRFQATPIPVESATELLSYSEVKGYNFYSSANALAKDFDSIESDTTEEAAPSPAPPGGERQAMFDADVSIQGVTFTDSVTDFMEETSTLVEGRHLTEKDLDTNVTVIEKSLAEENELSVGDTITVTSTSDETLSHELEIVGIYETTATGSDLGMNLSFMNPYNKLYVPYTVATSLKGTDYTETVDIATYYVNDPANIQAFVDEATSSSSIDFDTYKLDANDQLYEQMVGPIENVASFSQNVVYLVTIAGGVILGLIVMMSIRERKYEMGVLLAIGEKRWKLVGQFIAEILIVAVLALGIATLSGNVVAGQIGDQLLHQELAQSEETAANPASFGRGMGGRMGFGAVQVQQADPIDELTVEVTSEDLGILGLIGLAIAVLSTLLPSLSVLRLQPKAILTRQD